MKDKWISHSDMGPSLSYLLSSMQILKNLKQKKKKPLKSKHFWSQYFRWGIHMYAHMCISVFMGIHICIHTNISNAYYLKFCIPSVMLSIIFGLFHLQWHGLDSSIFSPLLECTHLDFRILFYCGTTQQLTSPRSWWCTYTWAFPGFALGSKGAMNILTQVFFLPWAQ